MNNVYLISEQEIRTASLLGNNVDSAYIQTAINYAQSIDLQEILGTKLHKSIMTQAEIHTWKSDEYRILVQDYIKPWLVQDIMSEIIVPITAKIRNAGVAYSNDTHYSGLSITDAQKVRDEYTHKASFLAARIFDYIIQNIEVFFDDVEGISRFVPLSSNTTKSPIFFGKTDYFDN